MSIFKRFTDPWRDSPLKKYRDGIRFTAPGSPVDLVGVFRGYGSPGRLDELGNHISEYFERYGNRFGVEATVPLSHEIYVEQITERHISIRAGNRVTEFWRIRITYVPSAGGCAGAASFTTPASSPYEMKWVGNLLDIFGGIKGAIRMTGGTVSQ